MEALLSTPASTLEVLASKLLPYYLLGLIGTFGCIFLTVLVFEVPLEGSLLAILAVSAVFLVPALGQGLLISTVMKTQFAASEVALITAFLPALLLSGLIFDIEGMPWPVQWITAIIPARYYVSSLQTIYLAGDIWSELLREMLAMLAVGGLFFAITLAKSRRGLD